MTPFLKLAEFRSARLIAAVAVTRVAAARRAPAPAGGDCPPNTTRVAPSGLDHGANDLTDDGQNSFGDGMPTYAALPRSAGFLELVERRLDAPAEAHLFAVVGQDGAILLSVAPGAVAPATSKARRWVGSIFPATTFPANPTDRLRRE